MSAQTLGHRTEPAPRTAAHEELRAAAPADAELYDAWHVMDVATLDADGTPMGVQTVRLPAVTTADPEKIRAREEWLRGLRQRRA